VKTNNAALDPSAVSAFVLAGGRSRRFRADKALQDWDGQPLLAHVVKRLQQQFPRVYVVGSNEAYARAVDAPLLADRYPNCGPLAGVHAGLCHTQSTWNLFVACDMPRVQPEVLSLLLANASQSVDAVVPQVDGWCWPTLALYRRAALPTLERALEEGSYSLQDVLKALRVEAVGEARLRCVDPQLLSLTNLNTPEAWRRARAWLEASTDEGARA